MKSVRELVGPRGARVQGVGRARPLVQARREDRRQDVHRLPALRRRLPGRRAPVHLHGPRGQGAPAPRARARDAPGRRARSPSAPSPATACPGSTSRSASAATSASSSAPCPGCITMAGGRERPEGDVERARGARRGQGPRRHPRLRSVGKPSLHAGGLGLVARVVVRVALVELGVRRVHVDLRVVRCRATSRAPTSVTSSVCVCPGAGRTSSSPSRPWCRPGRMYTSASTPAGSPACPMLRTDTCATGGIGAVDRERHDGVRRVEDALVLHVLAEVVQPRQGPVLRLRPSGSSRTRSGAGHAVSRSSQMLRHVVGVLAPERARADPRVRAVAVARRCRGTPCLPSGRASRSTPLMVSGLPFASTQPQPAELGSAPLDTMTISACPSPSMSASERRLGRRERRVRRREAHRAGRPVEDPEEALVGVDDLGLAVALEVEHRRAGDRRRQVVVRRLPEDVDASCSCSSASAPSSTSPSPRRSPGSRRRRSRPPSAGRRCPCRAASPGRARRRPVAPSRIHTLTARRRAPLGLAVLVEVADAGETVGQARARSRGRCRRSCRRCCRRAARGSRRPRRPGRRTCSCPGRSAAASPSARPGPRQRDAAVLRREDGVRRTRSPGSPSRSMSAMARPPPQPERRDRSRAGIGLSLVRLHDAVAVDQHDVPLARHRRRCRRTPSPSMSPIALREALEAHRARARLVQRPHLLARGAVEHAQNARLARRRRRVRALAARPLARGRVDALARRRRR